jgi:hypothetical protein
VLGEHSGDLGVQALPIGMGQFRIQGAPDQTMSKVINARRRGCKWHQDVGLYRFLQVRSDLLLGAMYHTSQKGTAQALANDSASLEEGAALRTKSIEPVGNDLADGGWQLCLLGEKRR